MPEASPSCSHVGRCLIFRSMSLMLHFKSLGTEVLLEDWFGGTNKISHLPNRMPPRALDHSTRCRLPRHSVEARDVVVCAELCRFDTGGSTPSAGHTGRCLGLAVGLEGCPPGKGGTDTAGAQRRRNLMLSRSQHLVIGNVFVQHVPSLPATGSLEGLSPSRWPPGGCAGAHARDERPVRQTTAPGPALCFGF